MQKLLILVLSVVMLSAAFVGVTSAQQIPNVPSITIIESFSSGTNYMSLHGYNRYQDFLRTGKWTLR